MTDRLELDRLVTDWLHDVAPAHAPDQTLAAALDRASTVGQDRFLTQRVFGDSLGRSARLRWGLALALVVAGVAGALVAGGVVPPTPPELTSEPSNGWVAYSVDGDIHVVRDGVADRRVIGRDGDGIEQDCATFSPDGGTLAYVETIEGDPEGSPWNIVLTGEAARGAPGGGAARFRPGDVPRSCPAWAPDGTRLAMLRDGAPVQLSVVGLDGSSTERFRHGSSGDLQETAFAWSPDGSELAVVVGSWPGTSEVWLVPADAGEPRLVFSGSPDAEILSSVTWSPDGSRIAVWGYSERETPDGSVATPRTHSIRLISVEGAPDATELDSWTEIDLHSSSGPAWAPDGSRLAYVRNGQIVVVAADGTSSRELSPAMVGGSETAPDDAADGTWWPGDLTWSPDGLRLLALGTDVPYLDRRVRSSVVSVDANGSSAPVVLTPWRLAYYADRQPDWQAVVGSVPAWGPDSLGVDDQGDLVGPTPPAVSPTPTLPPVPVATP